MNAPGESSASIVLAILDLLTAARKDTLRLLRKHHCKWPSREYLALVGVSFSCLFSHAQFQSSTLGSLQGSSGYDRHYSSLQNPPGRAFMRAKPGLWRTRELHTMIKPITRRRRACPGQIHSQKSKLAETLAAFLVDGKTVLLKL